MQDPIVILLVHDPFSSSLAYPMITHGPPVAHNLPIKTLVARQQPTNMYAHVHTHTLIHAHNYTHALARAHTHTHIVTHTQYIVI